MDDLEGFCLIPVTDIKAGKAEKDVTEDLVSDSDVEDATLTKDEGEAKTTSKSGKDFVTYPIKLLKDWEKIFVHPSKTRLSHYVL